MYHLNASPEFIRTITDERLAQAKHRRLVNQLKAARPMRTARAFRRRLPSSGRAVSGRPVLR